MSSGDGPRFVSPAAFSRLGTPSLLELYEHLRATRSVAPEGELAAFDGLLVASQYRLPHGLTLTRAARGSRVLDWGCGDGHFTRFLLEAGYTVTAYSLQHEPFVLQNLPEALRRRYAYVQGDRRVPTALPFGNSRFDVAVSIGVLEHVREEGGRSWKSGRAPSSPRAGGSLSMLSPAEHLQPQRNGDDFPAWPAEGRAAPPSSIPVHFGGRRRALCRRRARAPGARNLRHSPEERPAAAAGRDQGLSARHASGQRSR